MPLPYVIAIVVLGLAAGLLWRRRAITTTSQALATAAQALATASDPFAAMPTALAGLGSALGCDRLEFHQISHPPGGGLADVRLVCAWDAVGGPDRVAERPWHPGRTRWLVELAAGRVIAATVDGLPSQEADGLSGAIALAPLLAGGRLRGILLCSDRTRRPRQAEDLAALRVLGELVVAAQNRCDADAALLRANAEARSGARAKAEFLANISHELRTPLNGVLGMAGLLLNTKLDGQQREYAQLTRASAENLLVLLNDLISLAKAEGEQKPEFNRLDPLRMAEDVVVALAERAHTKGLEIAIQPNLALPRRVLGDAGRLRQVLVNLVGNAIKFTARGHVVVRVAWEGDGQLVYRVEDTGIGIDSEARARLFAAFVQADGSSTRRHGGSGLGLAISLRQTEIMGGKVTCESQPGQGSVFTVRVPSREASTSASGRVIDAGMRLAGTRVLVVESDSAVRAALVAGCVRLGLVASEVADCSAALTILAAAANGAEAPRVVLVAANIPGSGDLPREVGAVGSRAAFILVAHESRRPSQAEVARLGFTACLAKPTRSNRLAEAVAHALQRDPGSGNQREDTDAFRRLALRVLVVEDDAVNQMLARAVLVAEGIEVDIAGDGHDALEAMARTSYDAVLMDLLMPVMDGYSCAREIRCREAERNQPPVPILAVSAVDDREVQHHCLAAGMDGHVRKPFEPRHLRRMLRRLVIERRRAAGA